VINSFARAAALLLLATLAAGQPAKDRTVIVISLDGFPAYALADPYLPVPNLRQLIGRGSMARRMITVNPTVTWPNHTSMITGVKPARHSVIYNGMFLRDGEHGSGKVEPWRDKSEMVTAPTVYDLAYQAGLTTAQIDWVAIYHAQTITWSAPEVLDVNGKVEQEMIAAGLISRDDVEHFRETNITFRDEIWTQAAIHILLKHHPNLMLFHLLNTDSVHHTYGPKSLASASALALADARVGELVRAVESAGMLSRTTFLIVSDHGFKVFSHLIHPEVLLHGDAQVMPEGGTALIYLKGSKSADQIRAKLEGVEGIDRILAPQDFAAFGYPDPTKNHQMADLVIAAKDGYAFAAGDQGEIVTPVGPTHPGAHGYLNTDAEMNAIFIAAGAGIRPHVVLDEIRNLDVAPTIAKLLGLEMKNIEGKPLVAILQ
jgi:predicted AlkP superfamily pyrophosphatase or phosphodiesterase